MTWTFHLSPLGPGAQGEEGACARLHVRERYETRTASARMTAEVMSAVSALMTWRMLGRIAVLSTGRST